MTEREQVIAELLYLKRDCLEGSATDQTLDKAIALLKAQEAVAPIERNGFYYCGECRYAFTVHKQKYCTDCGRAVKWK